MGNVGITVFNLWRKKSSESNWNGNSGLVQLWSRCGPGLVQVWTRFWTDPKQQQTAGVASDEEIYWKRLNRQDGDEVGPDRWRLRWCFHSDGWHLCMWRCWWCPQPLRRLRHFRQEVVNMKRSCWLTSGDWSSFRSSVFDQLQIIDTEAFRCGWVIWEQFRCVCFWICCRLVQGEAVEASFGVRLLSVQHLPVRWPRAARVDMQLRQLDAIVVQILLLLQTVKF